MLIAVRLQENINHVSVLVDGAPEILPFTLNCHEEFVQVPDVPQASLSASEYMGVFGTELSAPLSNGLEGDGDPALCQQILNISEAQAETVVKPNSMADDIWRKSVSVIVGSIGAY
jgi:hypothetical protein